MNRYKKIANTSLRTKLRLMTCVLFMGMMSNHAFANNDIVACHINIPALSKIANLLGTKYNLNPHYCMKTRDTIATDLRHEYNTAIIQACNRMEKSASNFGLLPNHGSVSRPRSCPTDKIVAICETPNDITFIYDELLANSLIEKNCKNSNGKWLVK